MNSKQWKDLIKQEFGVSGSLAAKMYHEMLNPYRTYKNLQQHEKCPYYKQFTFGYVCFAQKGMPRCHCDGDNERCEK